MGNWNELGTEQLPSEEKLKKLGLQQWKEKAGEKSDENSG